MTNGVPQQQPPSRYIPEDWYWSIGGDTANVWSSARAMSVPTSDQNYIDWTIGGTRSAVPLDSMATLEGMMREQYPAGTLKTYNPDARYRKASGGCTVAGLPYLTDPVSRNTVGSAHDYAVANPGHITDWKLADGTFVKLNEAQLGQVLQQMATFVQSCFSCESANLTAINDNSMTTIAQIDAAYAAISNVMS